MDHKKNFYRAIQVLKENKLTISIVLVIFFIILIIGGIYHSLTYQGFSSLEIKEAYKEFIKNDILKESYLGNFFFIFTQNIVASLFTIVTGLIFAIIPLLLIITNTWELSYAIISESIDSGIIYTLIRLPHAIFELPAFIISTSLGLYVFSSLFKKGKKLTNLKNSYIQALLVFVYIILPLIVIAGLIESAVVTFLVL